MSTSNTKQPADAPPSYQFATSTGGSTASKPQTSHLEIPQEHNGIPAAARRSMEDENRPLPSGWVRQFDTKENHQFFVDTNANPPRSIWHHPYDDDEFLRTLSAEERERIQEDETSRRRPLTPASMAGDEQKHDSMSTPTTAHEYPDLPPRPDGRNSSVASTSGQKKGLGTKLKDKITGTTKEEREREKIRRAEEEREMYLAHQKFRRALQMAQQTGQPQFLGKDRDGKEVYIEPPQMGYGGGYGGYGPQAYGYNPYAQGGPYANPNARFIRPQAQYGRPYGPGYYGGGYGLPIMGGLLGGALLGGLLF